MAKTIKALVIASGGAGGGPLYNIYGAGAGAGGFLYNPTLTVTPGTYSITVGVATGDTAFAAGNNSSITNLMIAIGGGGGGAGGGAGGAGGSGGGGGGGTVGNHAGGNSTAGQGYIGGTGNGNQSAAGGGAGGVGGSYNSSPINGGVGLVNPITGSTVGENVGGILYLAGGGCPETKGTPGAGAASYGGGGQGQYSGNGVGTGGKAGIVLISYITQDFGNCTYSGTSNTITSGVNTILQMTTSGTLTMILTPEITTQAVSSIAATTATGNGTVVTANGTVSERGTVISTSVNPTTADHKDTVAGTTGAFTTSITSLVNNTLYHVRAYAINEYGTAYGADVTFTTLPEVTTVSVNSITQTSFIANGNLTNGGSEIVEIGFVWDTTLNPVITDNKVIVIGGMGAFYTLISGLTANTAYNVRAYATNITGTVYGTDIAFNTLASGPMIKRRVSFLSKAQSLTIQLSNNAVDETFTILQFAVTGDKLDKKTFTPASIISIN